MHPVVAAVLVLEAVLGGQSVVAQQDGYLGEHARLIVRVQVIDPPGGSERLIDLVSGDLGDVLAHPAGREGSSGNRVGVNDRCTRGEHLPKARLGLVHDLLRSASPGQLAADQHAGDPGERYGDDGAAPRREASQARLGLQGRGALREEPSLLTLHLVDRRANQLHQLLAPAADHRSCGGGRPAGATRLDGPLEAREAGTAHRSPPADWPPPPPALRRPRTAPPPPPDPAPRRPHPPPPGTLA